MTRFAGKVVLVTGSSSGIGEATAHRFATEGATVVVNSSTSVLAGEAVATELRAAGASAQYIRADVADAADRRALVDDTIAAYGRLDVLVNNAGTTKVIPHADLDGATEEIFRHILDVNLIGTFELTKLGAPPPPRRPGPDRWSTSVRSPASGRRGARCPTPSRRRH